MNNYEPVIGLEIHVELNTKSKMFCRCSADYFGKEPNTYTCPICLGLPGALPYINKAAIEGCIKIGLALNCTISEKSLFERKNYFYPDLPKGYQISQYRWPLCVEGRLQVTGDKGQDVTIRINRAHQEEDTGKLAHVDGETLIDFNRSGVPLVEIVTEPDFKDTSEVKDYAKKLQQLFRYLGVSNADMERGDMRLEANVSVRKVERHPELGSGSNNEMPKRVRHDEKEELPPYRVELKNINSFRFMVAAIEYEIKRQIEALEKGEKLSQETRGWNEDKKCTYLQRSKEEAHDYRYFPEPDLPEMKVDRLQVTVDSIRESLPELPWDKQKRFMEEYGLGDGNTKILTESKELAEFFEEAVRLGKGEGIEPKKVANYIVNNKVNVDTTKPDQIVEGITSRAVGVIRDIGELSELAKQSIKENSNAVVAYKAGKEVALQVLIGGVMRLSVGKADAVKIREILQDLLKGKP